MRDYIQEHQTEFILRPCRSGRRRTGSDRADCADDAGPAERVGGAQRPREGAQRARVTAGTYDTPFDFMDSVAFLASRGLRLVALAVFVNTFDAITSMLPMAT